MRVQHSRRRSRGTSSPPGSGTCVHLTRPAGTAARWPEPVRPVSLPVSRPWQAFGLGLPASAETAAGTVLWRLTAKSQKTPDGVTSRATIDANAVHVVG